jgi:hypothetical protein
MRPRGDRTALLEPVDSQYAGTEWWSVPGTWRACPAQLAPEHLEDGPGQLRPADQQVG